MSCEPASEGSLAQEKNFPSQAAPPARNKQERRLPAYRRKDQSGNNKMLLTVFSLSMLFIHSDQCKHRYHEQEIPEVIPIEGIPF